MKTEQLIESMTANLAPVRRYRAPWLRALGFLGFAAVLGATVAILHEKTLAGVTLDSLMVKPTLVSALLTGVLAAFAAFFIGQPDRSRMWSMLPVPAFGLWLGSLGHQCLTQWVAFGPNGMSLGETAQCFATFFVVAAPLGLAAVLMLKRMAVFERTRITLLGSLSVAGLTAAAMDVFHPVDASVLVILFNLGTALVLLGAGWLLGQQDRQYN